MWLHFKLGCIYSPSKNGKEWSLRIAKSLTEISELFLHEEPRRPDWKVDSDHRAVGTVSRPKGVVDEDVTQLGEGGSKRLHVLCAGLDLLPRAVHTLAFFFNVETKVL